MPKRNSLHVVGAAILAGGRCLVAQRGPGMALAGKWEFPGGKVERGEGARQALRRELQEELGVVAEVGDWLGRGETWDGSRAIRLDVYAATVATRQPMGLREHAQVRWVEAEELADLHWADADVPVVPAVRARLFARQSGAFKAHRCAQTPVILGVDWSKSERRRAACLAVTRSEEDGWRLAAVKPPPTGWTLARLVHLAGELREAHRRPVILGVDAALGVPAAFARAAGLETFSQVLRHLAAGGALTDEARNAERWSPKRPFFRVPPGAGGLTRFIEAAGGRGTLLRQIDLRTGAKSVFVLSGIPGSVGSGSRALWRELGQLPPALGGELRHWPFDGTLAELTTDAAVVLAEVYPRTAYGVALGERLPAPLLPLAKTNRKVRSDALERLVTAGWVAEQGLELDGLETARRSDDAFDALFVAAALVRLVSTGAPLADEPVDPYLEGGILGAVLAAADFSGSRRRSPPPGRRQ